MPTIIKTFTSSQGGVKNYLSTRSSSFSGWTNVGTGATGSTTTTAAELPELSVGTALKVTNGGSGSGYVESDFFQVDASDLGKLLGLTYNLETSTSPAYAANNFQIQVWDATTSGGTYAQNTTLNVANIPSSPTGGTMQLSFSQNPSRPFTRIRIVRAAGLANSWASFSSITVTSATGGQSAAVSEWQSFTPAFSYSAVTNVNMRWRRVGSGIEIQGEYNVGTTGSAEIRIPLPNNYTVSLAGSNTVALAPYLNDATSNTNHYWVIATNGNTYLNVGRWSADGVLNRLSASTAGAIATGRHSFTCSVPVAEFAGSGTVNLGPGAQVEYVADDGTNDVFGPLGAVIPTITAGTGLTSRTFSFQYPWQQDDIAVVEIRRTGQTNWEDAGHLTYIRSAANDHYGIRGRWSSSTVYQVDFGNRGYDAASGFGSNGNSWNDGVFDRWRVRKAKASAPVGFGRATATDTGLVFRGRHQTKILAANQTLTASITGLTFNNLTIGKVYRVSGQALISQNATNLQCELRFYDGGTIIGGVQTNNTWSSGYTGSEYKVGFSFLYTATTTTMTPQWNTGATSGILNGDGTRLRTFVTVEETDLDTTTAWA